jgi:hypothetical protein
MSDSNNDRISGKRTDFLDKLEKEGKLVDPEVSSSANSCASNKPKGTFLEAGPDQSHRAVERKAPSCGYRGG